jgi:hypothetical protein
VRIEFRLNLNNYGRDYLPYYCLSLGNVAKTIDYYSEILALIYKKYFYGIISVQSTEHPHFMQIYESLETAKERYTGDKVSKVEQIKRKVVENGHIIPPWKVSRRKFQDFLTKLEAYLEQHEPEWDMSKKYERIENMLQEYDEARNVDANRYSLLTIIQDELDDYDDVVEMIEHDKEHRLNSQNSSFIHNL